MTTSTSRGRGERHLSHIGRTRHPSYNGCRRRDDKYPSGCQPHHTRAAPQAYKLHEIKENYDKFLDPDGSLNFINRSMQQNERMNFETRITQRIATAKGMRAQKESTSMTRKMNNGASQSGQHLLYMYMPVGGALLILSFTIIEWL